MKPLAPSSSSLLIATALCVGTLCALACGVPPPDRLEIVPPTPIKFDELGKTVALQAHAFRGIVAHDDAKAPLTVTWSSSNAAVASVSPAGTVTAMGTGKAKIHAVVPGPGGKEVGADVDVDNLIVDAVKMTGEFPAAFKLNSKPVQLVVVVKNEQGVVVEKPRLRFSASDHCIEVTADGLVHPMAVGECAAIVEIAGKSARVDIDVKD